MATPKFNGNRTVRNFQDLLRIVDGYQEEFTQHIAEMVADHMQDYINEQVYLEDAIGNGDSMYYNRTGDLLNAIEVKRTSKGNWEVKIDGRHITSHARENTDMWGQHTGVDNSPQARNMAEWIDSGNNGSRLYSYEGIHYIEDAEKYANEIIEGEWAKFKKSHNLE